MILELLVNLIVGVATFLIDLIPDIEFSDGFVDGLSGLSTLKEILAYALPVETFMACLSVIFLLHNAQFIVSVGNWLIRKIPFIN